MCGGYIEIDKTAIPPAVPFSPYYFLPHQKNKDKIGLKNHEIRVPSFIKIA